MNKMIDSGVQWIGNIPVDWNIQRLKNILIERKENNKPIKTTDILSLTNTKGVIPYSEKGEVGNKAKENLEDYKLAYPNDIVLNSMNVVIGSVGLSKYFGCVSPVYYMLYSRNNSLININYYNYLFQTTELQQSLKGYGNGILEIRMRIPMDKLNSVRFPLPPLEIQNTIVEILDKKTKQIDELISNQEKQIEKLKEYKSAFIGEIVTKGLDPNAPMKDSGVEWIGYIPKGWETIRVKNTSWLKGRIGWDGLKSTEFIDEGPYLITGTDFKDGGIDWSTCVHISEERYEQDELLHIHENDLLITKDGSIGKLAIVKNCPIKVSLNSGVMIIRNTTDFKYHDRYIFYVLSSQQFIKWYELSQSGNSTIKHLYQEQFYNFRFTYPDFETQKNISDYLDSRICLLDKVIERKNEVIEYLKKYKKSLIYEYVTGKEEV